MSLTTSSTALQLNPIPTANSGLASGSHTLTASTNVPTGYNLALVATSAPSPALPAITGTITSPIALSNNTWGYALTKTGNNGATGITNNFDTTYTTPTPSTTSKWANPTTTTTIKNTTDSTTSLPASASTTVYYGAKADMTLPSGTYQNTVRYTATANIANIPTPTITSVTPNSGTTAGGTSIQIVGTGFTVNDQSVTTAVTVGGLSCTGVTISSNTPSTGRDTIYCNTPVHPASGAASIQVTTWKSTVTSTNSYTYITPTPTITTPAANQVLAANTTSTTLTVTTNINAICYYGSSTNPTTAMTTTGGTTHTQTITGLTNNSANARYVRCNAASGHSYSANTNVTFYIKAATPAVPSVSPGVGATVNNGTTTITVTSSGAACTWGTSNATATSNASGTTRTTTTGTNTIYYSCTASSGSTQSDARTGSWSYTGVVPAAQTGDAIQTVTTATCPTTRTRVYDARDGATYWIQKLADGRCWMLTNLAYGGYGTNTYGDTKGISIGTGGTGGRLKMSYTVPYYYVPPGSNRTTGTTDPSTSTDGTGQYGYLYNWCAAMGGQATSACAWSYTPVPNISISICPLGWRLPTGGSGGEYEVLTIAMGVTTPTGGNTGSAGVVIFRSSWLAMYSGASSDSFVNQGSDGHYWSSTDFPSENDENGSRSRYLSVQPSVVYPSESQYKDRGRAVRCIAS